MKKSPARRENQGADVSNAVLVIPYLEEEIESLRRDLRKLILLQQKAAEINEATSAAILNLLDRVEILERPLHREAAK